MQTLRAAIATLVASSAAFGSASAGTTMPPSAIIVDDSDPNFVKFGPSQWWYTSTGTTFNYHGGAMTWTGNVTNNPPVNYARWRLPLTATLPTTERV